MTPGWFARETKAVAADIKKWPQWMRVAAGLESDMCKVLVCGGRNFGQCVTERCKLNEKLLLLHDQYGFKLVIHGDCRGTDKLADQWAKYWRIPVLPVPADWKRYGKRAGRIRNCEMLSKAPDLVVAFPGGKGTAHMVEIAEKAWVKVIKVT